MLPIPHVNNFDGLLLVGILFKYPMSLNIDDDHVDEEHDNLYVGVYKNKDTNPSIGSFK